MFKDPTVVIVGAGASAEFGFPTGVGLYNEALVDLADTSAPGFGNGYEYRYLSTFTDFLDAVNASEELADFRRLQVHLAKSHATSIDLYAYNNPTRARIAKRYTAWRLIKHHFLIERAISRYNENTYRLVRNLSWRERRLGADNSLRPNWIGSLAQNFTSGARGARDLSSNALTIITFNYESVIEEAFPAIVRLDERFEDAADDVMPQILHLHGHMDAIKPQSLNPDFIERQADKIKFITDTIDSPSPEIKTAIEKLSDATRVYCVGFAFDKLNCDLLDAGFWGSKCWATNYDGELSVDNNMRSIRVKPERVWRGSSSDPMFVGKAAAKGFFSAP